MPDKFLTASAIRAIIETCGKNNVSRFVFHELTIEFTQSLKENVLEVPETTSMVFDRPEVPLADKAKATKMAFEDLVEEARLADPVLYEELIQSEDANAGELKERFE